MQHFCPSYLYTVDFNLHAISSLIDLSLYSCTFLYRGSHVKWKKGFHVLALTQHILTQRERLSMYVTDTSRRVIIVSEQHHHFSRLATRDSRLKLMLQLQLGNCILRTYHRAETTGSNHQSYLVKPMSTTTVTARKKQARVGFQLGP